MYRNVVRPLFYKTGHSGIETEPTNESTRTKSRQGRGTIDQFGRVDRVSTGNYRREGQCGTEGTEPQQRGSCCGTGRQEACTEKQESGPQDCKGYGRKFEKKQGRESYAAGIASSEFVRQASHSPQQIKNLPNLESVDWGIIATGVVVGAIVETNRAGVFSGERSACSNSQPPEPGRAFVIPRLRRFFSCLHSRGRNCGYDTSLIGGAQGFNGP